MKKLATIRLIVLSTIICSAISCTTVNSKVGGVFGLDTDLTLRVNVLSDINPDEANEPKPLTLRIYELKSDSLINKADFISLYDRDKATLGADYLTAPKIEYLEPGVDRVLKFVTSEEARYIALYAEFYRYKDANYKVVFPVTVNNVIRNSVRIKISGNTIELVE